jgi:ribosomal-protein-alanine N-acetyltransferase
MTTETTSTTSAASEARPRHPARPRSVYLRPPCEADRDEFLDLMHRSRRLHHPWIFPPLTEIGFAHYLQRIRRNDHEGFLVCERDGDAITGVININNIIYGAALTGTLGYYAGAPYAGRGLMAEALELVVDHAFARLGLHRLEANIQPGNRASIALVERCGFHREGYSPAFLYIAGAWRDHERWARLDPRAGLVAPPGGSPAAP